MAFIWTLTALAGIAFAQSTTLTLPFYGYDDQDIVASVVSVSDSVTTLSLACPQGTDETECGLFPEQVLTIGPSTYNMYMSAPGDEFIGTQDCSRAESRAVCSGSAGGSGANDPGSSTAEYDVDMIASLLVVVTAGVDQLADVEATTTSGEGSATMISSSGSGVSSATVSVTETMGTGTSSESTAAATSSGAALVNLARGGGVLGMAAGVVGGLLV